MTIAKAKTKAYDTFIVQALPRIVTIVIIILQYIPQVSSCQLDFILGQTCQLSTMTGMKKFYQIGPMLGSKWREELD